MAVPILSTKLFIPSVRENAVARSHLIERLVSGSTRPGCFTLVSGPAGFGKTTLLSAFVSRFNQPVAWVSLDTGDNDPNRFWSYVIMACQSILAGVGESAQELLDSPQPLPDDTIASILINDLSTQDGSILLILDDYHEIQNPSIHAGLLFLLDHIPPNFHPIISTRGDPPWPLARFRVRNQLTEIRTRDLRFSSEEAAQFLNHTMGLAISIEDIAALEDRIEGWAAGLQLAGIALQSLISLQGQSDIAAFVEAFTGSHIYVAEYLVEEVLQRQPEDIRTFLLQTSILERMNAGLCEAVTGRLDGQSILQSLRHANIFVLALDDQATWFRYHHLFADLLQARLRQSLPVEMMAELHGRASAWYECNGFTREAVSHALAARDFERVAGLVEGAARALIFSGRVNVLRDWLEALPESSFSAHPYLAFYLFWIDALQSKADLSEQAIQEKEKLLKALPATPDNDRLRGELMAVICRAVALSGRTSRGIRLAREALGYLPADSLAARARANSAIAAAHALEGRVEEAEHYYQICFSQAIAAGDYRLAAHVTMVKGLIQCLYGQLHEASKTFQAIIAMGERIDIAVADQVGSSYVKVAGATKRFFPAGQGYIGLGRIHLEWNDLKMAENLLTQGMELCRQGGLDGIFIARVQMSRLRQAQGDLDGAQEEIRLPEQAMNRVDNFDVAVRQILIGLARDDIEHAVRWAAPFVDLLNRESPAAQPPLLVLEILEAVVARVCLARGEIEAALQYLDRLQDTAEPGKRLARMIETYMLRALAYQKQAGGGPTQLAIENMEQALMFGEAEGNVLLFLEEGPQLVPLLKAVHHHQAAPERVKQYAGKLLEAFNEATAPASSRAGVVGAGLVEPLTPREMEVLVLLAAGDSNQTIAEKLFITVRTVKKHVSNIYGKLNAGSRTQAVALAREHGLLPSD